MQAVDSLGLKYDYESYEDAHVTLAYSDIFYSWVLQFHPSKKYALSVSNICFIVSLETTKKPPKNALKTLILTFFDDYKNAIKPLHKLTRAELLKRVEPQQESIYNGYKRKLKDMGRPIPTDPKPEYYNYCLHEGKAEPYFSVVMANNLFHNLTYAESDKVAEKFALSASIVNLKALIQFILVKEWIEEDDWVTRVLASNNHERVARATIRVVRKKIQW